MGYRVLAIGLVTFPELSYILYWRLCLDSGEEKKELCLKVGADKWLDFRESKDLTKDVQDATDGLGPHAAMVTVGDVSSLSNESTPQILNMKAIAETV